MKSTTRAIGFGMGVFVACLGITGTLASAQTLTVVQPSNHIVSPRASDLHGNNNINGPIDIPHRALHNNGGGNPNGPDPVQQTLAGPLINATPGASFDGLSVYQGGYIPSDNNIAVGPARVMETVNAAFAIYDKSGNLLTGPTSLKSLWTGLGGECANNNGGDTVVQYDRAADRWIMTQLGSVSGPTYSECIAVSTTNDPAGTYNLYSYSFAGNLNDYPKFGVWSTPSNSAYLATYNLFQSGSTFLGPEICAYDRAAMIAGTSAIGLCYTNISGASFLPSDVDGPNRPLDGTPGYFMELNGSSLGVYTLAPNFAAQTATLGSFTTIPVAAYSGAPSAVQPGTTETLDSLSDRLMYRLAFRMFSDHEAIVVNHAVVTGSSSGERWYELRAPVSTSGAFTLFQQGTFAPDSNFRWMGSVAMDSAGDMALGYSVSSATVFPSVRYTGRVPTDASGTMETEGSIKEGAGSQTGYTRWGDYSAMRIDPSDDCTFWYVNEYLPVSSSYGWYTHIGSFKFSGCGTATPDFGITANPTSITAASGGSAATSTLTVSALNGFTDSVNLTIAGCPTASTCSVNPTQVLNGAGTSTLSVSAASTTPAGSYTVTVTGTDASNSNLTHSVPVTVNVVAPDFTISANPSTLNAADGGPAQVSTITITPSNGFSHTVGLSYSGCPTGATCSFNPTSVSGSGTSQFSFAAGTVVAGSYPVTIKGTDTTNGALSHSTTVTVSVTVPDFSLSVSPTALNAVQGGAAVTSKITITSLNGFNSAVTLAASGCPGLTYSLNPAAVTPTANGSVTSTLTVTPNQPASCTLTVTGNSIHPASVTVKVFSITLSASSLTVKRGGSGTLTVTANGGGSVALSASGLPSHANASFSPSSVSAPGSSTLTISTQKAASPGTSTVSVTGTSSGLTFIVKFTLTLQ